MQGRRREKEVGVTWELVCLAMGQVAVKWNTTSEWRASERVAAGKEGGAVGRSGKTGGGGSSGGS
jgi:hypothetical protein